MNPQEPLILELIEQIYAAAVDCTLWSGVLETLMQATNSSSGVIYAFNPQSGNSRILTDDHLHMKSMEAYCQYYATIDPWHAYMISRPAGEVFYSQQAAPDTEFEKTEFYNDFLKPQGIFHAMGGIVSVIDEQIYVLGVQRHRDMGSYENDTRLLKRLFPHLERAFNVSAKLEGCKNDGEQNCCAMDQLAVGIMLLDQSLKIKHMNSCMREIIANDGVLEVTTDSPRAIDYQENLKLKAKLSTVLEQGNQDDPFPPSIMKLGRSAQKGLLTLFARPVQQHDGYLLKADGETGVILFLTGRSNKNIPNTLLCEIYGLSPMQAVVCEKVASGLTIKEVSEQLDITRETTKTHLKAIFQRTGVRRQADLIHLLSTHYSSLTHE